MYRVWNICKKLIKLCRKEKIEFVAVTTPIPEETLKKYQESYEEAWNYFETFFGKEKVQYLNFNTTYYELFFHMILILTQIMMAI